MLLFQQPRKQSTIFTEAFTCASSFLSGNYHLRSQPKIKIKCLPISPKIMLQRICIGILGGVVVVNKSCYNKLQPRPDRAGGQVLHKHTRKDRSCSKDLPTNSKEMDRVLALFCRWSRVRFGHTHTPPQRGIPLSGTIGKALSSGEALGASSWSCTTENQPYRLNQTPPWAVCREPGPSLQKTEDQN